jgi:hypothetical protein
VKLTQADQQKIQDRQLANILRKLHSGKTLTAREETKLQAATAGAPIDTATGYVGTWDELAQRLDVSRRAIQDWRSDPRYKPEIERRAGLLERADGRHCVAEWMRLMVDLQLKRGKAAAEAVNDPENAGDSAPGVIQPPAYGGSQADWTKAKIAKDVVLKDIEIETTRGTLLEAPELELPIGATFAVIQTKLSQFPSRVARFLVGLREMGEIEDRLRDEMDADLSDLHDAGFTSEDAVAEAVAGLPFDADSERLFTTVCFDGQDRGALLQLITLVATRAVRQLGRRAIARARCEAELPDTAIADAATGQVTDEAAEREGARRSAPGHSELPAVESVPAPAPSAAPAAKSKRKKKARPQPTVPPAAMEASVTKATPRQRK